MTVDVDQLLAEMRTVYPAGLPNLFRTLKGNPAVLSAFLALDSELEAHGRLTPAERLLVGLITAEHVECGYCQAALSKEAVEAGTPEPIVEALLDRGLPNDDRARTLAQAARRILELHGRLPSSEIAHFERRGLDEASLLEIIAVVGEFTIATYANHLKRTRLDPEYRSTPAARPPQP